MQVYAESYTLWHNVARMKRALKREKKAFRIMLETFEIQCFTFPFNNILLMLYMPFIHHLPETLLVQDQGLYFK